MEKKRLINSDSDVGKLEEALKFSKEILPSVSRTFDLAIRFLPTRLGRPVGLAYLLCRIADTFEDSEILTADQRRENLLKYSRLFNHKDNYDNVLLEELKSTFINISTLDDNLIQKSDCDSNHMLVQNLDRVLLAVDSLPDSFKHHIFPRVQEMSFGMADYTLLAAGPHTGLANQQVNFLKDEADWDRYCYYVAGTVGHMLTDIFSDYAGFADNTRYRLHNLGRSFGLGLQKVNILKDAVVDTGRGICFLPKTYIENYGITFGGKSAHDLRGDITGLVRHIVLICRRHFQDAIEYIKVIPVKYLGLRMFLIVPVMLAAATLRLFSDYPQRLLEKGDLKLGRNEVWSLVRRSAFCKYSNRLLLSAFNQIYPA
jgi:farnesyl-diphosphate farnesyltransferase